jgi:hypothetical protein
MDARKKAFSTARIVGIAGIAMMLSGCYGYNLDHRETISASAGDAQAVNRALMIKDPWPPGAWNKSIAHDGTRMGNAIDAYRAPPPAGDTTEGKLDSLSSGPTTSEE